MIACPTGNWFAGTMTTLSATHAAANRLLRTHLYSHLDHAEFLAMKATVWTDADADQARELLPDLVTVIRRCLATHADSDDGHCLRCGVPWPCPTVETIHDELLDPRHHFQPLCDLDTPQDTA